MFDFVEKSPRVGDSIDLHKTSGAVRLPSVGYRMKKRIFDLVVAIPLLAAMGIAAVFLLVLNPFQNRGQLFFVQNRMGRDCRSFRAWKFRSMVDQPDAGGSGTGTRGAFDPLDSNRITRLGRILRKSRIDELPQVINVLCGEMSLIGPRPDAYSHAIVYAALVPEYRARYAVLPGITGLAQTEVGYVDGREGVVRKVAADMIYLRDASMRLDLWITWRTIRTVFGRQGA